MSAAVNKAAEWLEADGLGGFASGTVGGERTRRYHALLLAAGERPAGRFVLVNGFDAWVETGAGEFAISSQRYAPDVVYPDGRKRLEEFEADPWPRWVFRLEDGTRVEQELFAPRGTSSRVVRWRVLEGAKAARLTVRPFLSGRDYHSLHHENPAFRFDPEQLGEWLVWRPYEGVPVIASATNGRYSHHPDWYRGFLYTEERARGLDSTEDLASPGVFTWDLSRGDAAWILSAATERPKLRSPGAVTEGAQRLRAAELQRREQFPSRLERAADAYVVRRGSRKTIVAGYPWFTDWGRDTFIALRGLCLATGRLHDARDILLDWAGAVSEGMLPNLFPDGSGKPEFNSVDASLWYIVAVHEYLQAAGQTVSRGERRTLLGAVEQILSAYARGTRYRIHVDDDGLLAAGERGVQLTWMDAKVGDWVVTPRIGKAVEVQALWLNALSIGSRFSATWQRLYDTGRRSFGERFWNDAGGYLFDVVDPDHRRGTADATFRPNQIFAVGGLPVAVLEGERARRLVDAVEARLWTPLGLRSLEPGAAGYAPRYAGGVRERDGAYHQGTVWPWLMGPFVEAWVRVRGGTGHARREARARFLSPILAHLDEAGLGHVSEISDGDPPHTPRGCPFQAWSVGEVLRLDKVVLAEDAGELPMRRGSPRGSDRQPRG